MGSIPTPGTMKDMLRKLYRRIQALYVPHTPLIEIRINADALRSNLHTYQRAYPSVRFAPVLKSNAYGHGLVPVARVLDREDIAFFMVDSYYEARTLRAHGIRTRILVMGYVDPHEIAHSRLPNIDFAITDPMQLKELLAINGRRTRIHLKIDTGMHRQGIMLEELPEAIELLKNHPQLDVVGIASHFADADNDDESFSRTQIAAWKEACSLLDGAFPKIEYRHLAATKGARFMEDAGTNVGRLGIGLYGIDTSPTPALPLRPVLSMRSIVASVRTIRPGDSVGYNATYTAPVAKKIACVPVGYFEGVDRRLSNKGAFLIDNIVCPITGRVSMNMTSVDITGHPEVRTGLPVLVISDKPEDPNSIAKLAALAESTPYVLLAHLPAHLKRTVESSVDETE